MKSKLIIGLHISGPNAGRTCLAALRIYPNSLHFDIESLHDNLRHYGHSHSDDRIVDILKAKKEDFHAFCDAPLDLPPCLKCTLPACPGQSQCQDPAVAYMDALAQRMNSRKQRRARPINPQSHRLSDMLYRYEIEQSTPEYSKSELYDLSKIPLSTRARTLQKRLNHDFGSGSESMKEISLSHMVSTISEMTGLPQKRVGGYRQFQTGGAIRAEILDKLSMNSWLTGDHQNDFQRASEDSAIFMALLTAIGGGLSIVGCHWPKNDLIPKGSDCPVTPILKRSIENHRIL
jgi:hypothetical protein